MLQNQQKTSVGNSIVCWLTLANVLIIRQGYTSHPGWYQLAWITVPLLIGCLVFSYRRRLHRPIAPVRSFTRAQARHKTGTTHFKKPGVIRFISNKAS